jgi:haloacetate dehalogenase
VLGVWRPWATELSGHGLDSAHHIAEEAPQELTHALLTSFGHTAR